MWGNKDYEEQKARADKAELDRKALEDRLKAQETELATSKTTLSTMEGSFKEVKDKLAELEANPRRGTAPPTNTDPPQRTSFMDNEDTAFNERFIDAAKPLAAAALIAGRNSAKLEAKLSLVGEYIETPGGRIPLSALWTKWMPEIEKAASEVAPANLVHATTWINMFDYIKGKHISEMMKAPETFIETVQTNVQSRVGGDQHTDEKLNDEELAAIKKMGGETGGRMTPEKYAEMKKKMKFVSV